MDNIYMAKPILPNNEYEKNEDYNSNNVNNFNLTNNIVNILKQNKKRKINIFTSFPKISESKDEHFSGILETVGYDNVIISEPSSGKWKIIPTIYIDYITFDEPINYN